MPDSTSRDYDLLVIGGGSAGFAAADLAGKAGAKTALLTSPGPLGGLCILKGCMPSKTLIESANRLRDFREAEEFGIRGTGGKSIDLQAVQARKKRLIDDFQSYRVGQLRDATFDLLIGTAEFVDEYHIKLEDGTRIRAKAFVIATGSTPFVPKIPGLAGTPYLTSNELLEIGKLPGHLLILGGGVVGMEFAHCFEGFGSRVTVIQRSDRILTALDPDLAAGLEEVSKKRGIDFKLGFQAEKVLHDGKSFHLSLDDGSELTGDQLLVATGRRANSDRLNLEKIGLELEKDRIRIDRECRTSVSHIFAAGDCASPFPYVHLAVIQGEVAAKNALRDLGLREGEATWNPALTFAGIFTHPEIVQIGVLKKESEKAGIAALEASYPFSDHGKAMIAGATAGFVKLIAQKNSGRLIGASAIGPGVVDYSHLVLLAIERGMTAAEFASLPLYHPTLAEIWYYPAEELAKNTGS